MAIVVAVVDEAPLEDGLNDDDDDDTAAEVLDVADVDRAMRGVYGSSPMTKVDMMDRMRAGDCYNENVTLLWKKKRKRRATIEYVRSEVRFYGLAASSD